MPFGTVFLITVRDKKRPEKQTQGRKGLFYFGYSFSDYNPQLPGFIVPGPVLRQNIMQEECGGAEMLAS